MDVIFKSVELLEKLLPILQSLPLWARYVVSFWLITGVIIWTSVFFYRLVSPQNELNEVSSQQSGQSIVQQQTIENSPASTNIQGRDIIIEATPRPIEATTARERLGRLSVTYSPQGFIDSAQHGDTAAVKLFVEAGMNVNSKADNYGRTALMEAAQAGHLDTVEALIRKKAEANAQDELGDTALILAANRGYLEVVRTLLRKHAEPNIQNVAGRTALRAAAENGHKLVVLALLDNGARLETRDREEQQTPLLAAAMHHQTEVVQVLLDRGSDANVRDTYGHSALIPAARAGHVDMVKALLTHGADVNAAAKDGRTALMGAAVNGHIEVIALLLEHQADLKLVDKEGFTALIWAESRGQAKIKELLQKAAAGHNM